MTPMEYEDKLASQSGHCALCEAVQGDSKRRMPVDHDHACCASEKGCGRCNRGILCANCNRKVGFLEALLIECWVDPEPMHGSWLYRALAYLSSYQGAPAMFGGNTADLSLSTRYPGRLCTPTLSGDRKPSLSVAETARQSLAHFEERYS